MIYTLKLFNTGQITLPKAWREKFNTKHFLAREKDNSLVIEPIKEDQDVVYYEDHEGYGLAFPKGIDPQILINKLKEIDG